MIALAALQGLRRAEIARVHMRDLVQDDGGWVLIVRGKGDKERPVPVRDDVVALIRAEQRSGWLFPGHDHGHLSAHWVGRLVAAALPDGWSAHPLRTLFASRVYAGSGDLLALQDLLGHASPETTRAYVRLSDGALRRAVTAAGRLLPIPGE
jgi:integrase